MVDFSDSNFGCSEIRKPMMRKRDYDDDYEEVEISGGTEAMPRRRKQPKKNTIPPSRMIWTKDNELTILKVGFCRIHYLSFSFKTFLKICLFVWRGV